MSLFGHCSYQQTIALFLYKLLQWLVLKFTYKLRTTYPVKVAQRPYFIFLFISHTQRHPSTTSSTNYTRTRHNPSPLADLSRLKMGCGIGSILTTPRNEYKVLKKLGEGGQGKAFLVRRIRYKGRKEGSSGALVVCKEEKRGDSVEVRILREVLAGRNKRIPEFFEAGTGHGNSLIFLEYCNAGDLHEVIEWYYEHNRSIPEGFVWTVFCHLSEALAYLHKGFPDRVGDRWDTVLHRDIKPPNVFLTWPHGRRKYPDVLLGDFGMAALPSDPDFDPENDGGTYEWQPPEAPKTSTRADVWALGAIIHACCNGGPPISPKPRDYGGTYRSWCRQPGAKKPTNIYPRYSWSLQNWMTRALKKETLDRISSYELATLMVPGDGRTGRLCSSSELAEGSIRRNPYL